MNSVQSEIWASSLMEDMKSPGAMASRKSQASLQRLSGRVEAMVIARSISIVVMVSYS